MTIRARLVLGCLGLFTLLGVHPVGAGESAEALRIARESRARWTIGAVRARGEHGRIRAQADLVADGVVVAHLRLDPRTGELVAEKISADRVAAEDIARLTAAAGRALSQVEVGGWAWPADHGRGWRVPLRYRGRVIGTITVDVARNRVAARASRNVTEGEE